MIVSIPDEVAVRLGPHEREVLIELACRLFDADLIDKPQAARMSGLSRPDFEDQLRARNLAVWHLDDDFETDLRSLRELGRSV